MSDIPLTELMEYYFKEDLSFLDIVKLLSDRHIKLENGMVSEEDLKTIISTKDLSRPDHNQFNGKKQDEALATFDTGEYEALPSEEELEAKIEQSEKKIFALEKQAKRESGNSIEKELINEHIDICKYYEQLSILRRGNANEMLRYRTRLNHLLENSKNPDKDLLVENKRKLGKGYIRAKYYTRAMSFIRDAEKIYNDLLAGINLAEARAASEYTAKLGTVHFMLFNIKSNLDPSNTHMYSGHIDHAECLIKSYVKDNKQNPYFKYFRRIAKAKEKCRKSAEENK